MFAALHVISTLPGSPAIAAVSRHELRVFLADFRHLADRPPTWGGVPVENIISMVPPCYLFTIAHRQAEEKIFFFWFVSCVSA